MVEKKKIIIDEATVYTWFCTGIVYAMLFWTYGSSILSILLAAYWLFRSKKKFDIRSRQTRLMLVFIALYLIALVGMLYTSNTQKGIFSLQKQSALLFFPLIFGTTAVLNASIVKKITMHFAIATGIAALAGIYYGFLYLNKGGSIGTITGHHLMAFYDFHPVSMGLYCILSTIIVINRILERKGREQKLLLALAILLSVFIFLLSIRLVVICWFGVILYYIIKQIPKTIYRVSLVIGALIIAIVASVSIPSLRKQWKEAFDFSGQHSITLDQDASLGRTWGGKAIRVAIWRCAAGLVKEHWLTGVGTGDVQEQLQQAYEDRKFYFASRYNQYNAHNQFLQTTVAFGIAGLVILLACIIMPLMGYRNAYENDIYLLFLLLFAAVSMTEVILAMNKGILWYSFFNSILAFGNLKRLSSVQVKPRTHG